MHQQWADRHWKSKRTLWAFILISFFVAIFVAWFLYWFLFRRFETQTEDAYVGGNIVEVTASVNAPIIGIYAERSDLVEENQLLVELDVSELKIQLDRAEALLAQAVREAIQARERAVQAFENLRIREIEEAQAALDFTHRKNLQLTGALPQEEIEKSQSNLELAWQRTKVAESEYKEALARIEGTTIFTDPLVEERRANFIESYVHYRHAKITSPIRGYVAQREVQNGESVVNGQRVMSIVPLDEVWVTANFKETKLESLGIGQPVTLYSEAYGKHVQYKGEIYGAVPGTGVSFSLLPPQNATGNWIKIVQRVPVLIRLCEEPPARYPLLLGLSMNVKVHTKNREQPLLPLSSARRFIEKTSADDSHIEEGKRLAEEIIQKIYE